jgi:hypothetical protein
VPAENALLGLGERALVAAGKLGDVGGVEAQPGGAVASLGLEADGERALLELEVQAGAEAQIARGAAFLGELLEIGGERGERGARSGAERERGDGEKTVVDPLDGDAELVVGEREIAGRGGDERRVDRTSFNNEIGVIGASRLV